MPTTTSVRPTTIRAGLNFAQGSANGKHLVAVHGAIT
jgi:hypothetical protein